MENVLDLSQIAEQIARIEEINPDYIIDKNWIKLRKTQNLLFSELAKYKVKKLKSYLMRELNTEKRCKIYSKILEYNKFIIKGGVKNEKCY